MAKIYEWKDSAAIALATRVALWSQIGLRSLEMLLAFTPGAMTINQSPEFSRGQLVFALVAGLALLSVIVALPITATWIFRVNSNAHVFRRSMQHGPWGSILFYFVPVASLVVPYLAMVEIWDASGGARLKQRSHLVLGCWWAVMLAGGLVGIASYLVRRTQGSTPSGLYALDLTLRVGAAALFLIIVRRITRMQKETYVLGVFSEDSADAGIPELVIG